MNHYKQLYNKIYSNTAKIGIIGLGYVGLPLALEFANSGFKTRGFDIDNNKIEHIRNGKSYISYISSNAIKNVVETKLLEVTSDFSKLEYADCIIICVPTPLTEYREPDLKYVINTSETISKYLSSSKIVILESTTYPGTTEQVVLKILGNTGLIAGTDYFLGYSPEREDPGNDTYKRKDIPKVVAGYSKDCLNLTKILYGKIFNTTVPVSSLKVAESSKILENIYRSVNIALVNELKIIFDKMNIDIWEVIEAASTKPFGFTPFYPGPGLGGHCIPIDPFYLSWAAKSFDINTRFIELAGEINTNIPYYVFEKISEALNSKQKSISGSKILLLGVAYKKDVDDTRESPSLKIMSILISNGANVDYHDPYVPVIKNLRKYPDLTIESISLTEILVCMIVLLLSQITVAMIGITL